MAGHPDFDHTPTQTEDHDRDPQPPICTEAFDGIPDDASSATSDELEDDDPVVAQYVSRERPVRSREEWQERREELKREQDEAERERRERELQERLARERQAVQERQKARKRRQERERRQRRSKERQERNGKLRQHALKPQVDRENQGGLRLQNCTTGEKAAIKERQRVKKRRQEKERRQRRKKEQQPLTATLRPTLLRQQSSREVQGGLTREDDMTVNKEAIKERQRVRKRRREKERRKRRKSEQRGLEDARRQALMKEVKERAESRRRAEREKQEMLHFKEERLVEWLRDQEERRTNLGSQRLAKESQSQQLVEDENEHQDACNSELEADRTEFDSTAAPETPVTQAECLDVDVSGPSPESNDSETDPLLPTDLAGRTTINVTPRTQNKVLGPIPRILRRPVSKPNRYQKRDIAEQVVLFAASTSPFTATFSTGGSRTLECSRPTMHAQCFFCRLMLHWQKAMYLTQCTAKSPRPRIEYNVPGAKEKIYLAMFNGCLSNLDTVGCDATLLTSANARAAIQTSARLCPLRSSTPASSTATIGVDSSGVMDTTMSPARRSSAG
ncbi:hypothetical protein CF326_g2149 [Tilletia indica]|nr:hypothetical protein CF326_g2149 [Tilletia indica]